MKKITDLKVKDLRTELEKRGLDKTGLKAAMASRLAEALASEGVSVKDFLIQGGYTAACQDDKVDLDTSKDNQQKEIICKVEEGEDNDASEADLSIDDTALDKEAKPEETANAKSDQVQNSSTVEEKSVGEGKSSEEKKPVEDKAVPDNKLNSEDKSYVEVKKEVVNNDSASNDVTECGTDNEGRPKGEKEHLGDEEDNDELQLNIGEEETLDGEESDNLRGAQTESEKPVDKEVHVNSNDGADDSMNSHKDNSKEETLSGSAGSQDRKKIERSEEGRSERKSKDEDRNTLLVTGLSPVTAAKDIKLLFKKYGKIGGVKIMSNAKDPDGSRFALVAVLSSPDVEICINNLDGYNLHNRIIHVDKAGDDMLNAEWARKMSQRDSKHKKESKKSSSRPASSSQSTREGALSNEEKEDEKDEANVVKKDTPKNSSKSDNRPEPQKSENSTGNETSKVNSRSNSLEKSKSKTTDSKGHEAKRDSQENKRFSQDTRKGSPPRRPTKYFPPRSFPIARGGLRVRPRFMDGDRHDNHRRFVHHRGNTYRPPYRGRGRSPSHRFSRRDSPNRDRHGGRSHLTFDDIYNVRQREKGRELERERREAEKRRIFEEEKQRELDNEIRMLARQRQKIEEEKAELKRQKERLIMEEKEKQRLEKERLQKEKEEVAKREREMYEERRKVKRHAESSYDHSERKKPTVVDDRTRSTIFMEQSISESEKDKFRSFDMYRKPEASRYGHSHMDYDKRGTTSDRSHGRSVPVREAKLTWETDPARSRISRTADSTDFRHISTGGVSRDRERDIAKSSRDRRDDHTTYNFSGVVDNSRYNFEPDFSSTKLSHTRGGSKVDTYGRDKWESSSSYTTELSTGLRVDYSTAAREPTSWTTSSDRLVSDRWSGNSMNTSRITVPIVPPPPMFSEPAMGLQPSGASYHSGLYGNSYDYKMSLGSSRRQ